MFWWRYIWLYTKQIFNWTWICLLACTLTTDLKHVNVGVLLSHGGREGELSIINSKPRLSLRRKSLLSRFLFLVHDQQVSLPTTSTKKLKRELFYHWRGGKSPKWTYSSSFPYATMQIHPRGILAWLSQRITGELKGIVEVTLGKFTIAYLCNPKFSIVPKWWPSTLHGGTGSTEFVQDQQV